jgi:hypothetical protein
MTSALTAQRLSLLLLGLALLVTGYLLDGVTEPGHHAALILGAGSIGYGLAR